jgi:hypothetical protein
MYSGFDIGFLNLGLVSASSDGSVTHVERISLSGFSGKCLGEKIEEFLTERLGSIGDVCILERQPPHGMQDVQSLVHYILLKTGREVHLVHPRALHKHFGMSDDYDERKRQSEQIALQGGLGAFPGFCGETRRHDMADAFLLITFWLAKLKKEEADRKEVERVKIEAEERRKRAKALGKIPFEEMIEQFRFRGTGTGS